jgi:signal transduction histidine kinase
VLVRLRNEGMIARLSIQDDGVGFDTTGVPVRARGLAGMRFRVASHGGRLDLISQPGRGTTIEALLPQRPAASAPSTESSASAA